MVMIRGIARAGAISSLMTFKASSTGLSRTFAGTSRSVSCTICSTLGATAGLALDGATAGIAFGLFTVGGGAAGAIAGWTGTRPLSRLKVEFGPFSRELGGCRIKVGPLRNPQLMFVLLDRALIYFQCVSNWTHARRDDASISLQDGKMGWTSSWDRDRRRAFEKYQAYLQKDYFAKAEELQPVLRQILIQVMREELNQDIGQP